MLNDPFPFVHYRNEATSLYAGWGKFVSSIYPMAVDDLFKIHMWSLCIVKNVMQERGQEPYIAFKLEAIMKEANFEVIKTDQRDTYLGNETFTVTHNETERNLTDLDE